MEFYFCDLHKENKGFEFCDSSIFNFTLFFKMSELLKISRKTGTSKMHIYFFCTNLAIQMKIIARFSTP